MAADQPNVLRTAKDSSERSNRYTLVHLSDLHYRRDWPEECGLNCSKLIEDLKTTIGPSEQAYIVFSGDLVQAAGTASSYESFDAAVARQLDSVGLSRDRRICVPGNHDVSRLALDGKIHLHEGALKSITNETTFNNSLGPLASMFLLEKFKPYQEYEAKFA